MLTSKQISDAFKFIQFRMETADNWKNYKNNHYLKNDNKALDLLDSYATAREEVRRCEYAQNWGEYDGKPISKPIEWDEDGEAIDYEDEEWFVELMNAAKEREEELANAVNDLEIDRSIEEDEAEAEALRIQEEKDWEDGEK